MIETMAKEEHKFGYCTFGSTVVSADDACLQQFQSGFVASHFDYATLALSDVNNNDATFCGVLQLADEPFLLRSISRTECFEYNRFQTRDMENRIDDAFLDTGKKSEHNHIGIEQVMRLHGTRRIRTADDVGEYAYLRDVVEGRQPGNREKAQQALAQMRLRHQQMPEGSEEGADG